jgi:alpha-mannosidase
MHSLKTFKGRKPAALFIVSILVSLSLAFPVLTQAQDKPDLSRQKILFTVGYAHLDTQWRWDYQKTIREYI